MDSLLDGPLRDWKIGITGPPYNSNYWPSKKEGEKPFECWCHEKLLGKGGFGEVWREVCKEGAKNYGQVRAVKKISKKQAGFLKSSQRELMALTTFSKLKYRYHFVQFIGWYEDNNNLYLAMDFMKYGDLQQYIDGLAPFSEPQAAAIAEQVAQALKHVHANGFLHRDLKPQNILVAKKEPTWRVKVADFGIAKNVFDNNSFFMHYIGTRGYMAPETFQSWEISYTAAVDVWALGAVVYCMLTGDPPFETMHELLDYRKYRTEFPTGELGATTGFCIDFVLAAMQPCPSERSTIDRIHAHEWLSPNNRGVFRHQSLSRPRSITTMGYSWRRTASPFLSNKASQSTPTTKPALSKVISLSNITPHHGRGNGEIYCMICWAKFDRRSHLFNHTIESGHIAQPGKGDIQEPTQRVKDRIENRQLERQTRQSKETQLWKDFLKDQEQKNTSLASLSLEDKKPQNGQSQEHQGGLEMIVNFFKRQELMAWEEKIKRLRRKQEEEEVQRQQRAGRGSRACGCGPKGRRATPAEVEEGVH